MGRVSTYICGNGGPGDEFNPSKVTRQEHAPELLFLLNSEPRVIVELSKELGIGADHINRILGDLSRINAVVERGGKWDTAFAVFSKRDVELISERARVPALRLAKDVMSNGPEVECHLSKIACAGQVEMKKLLFAVIGCFILDWKGLEILNDKDLTLCGRKPQPGDRHYVLLGKEEGAGDGMYERMYWGSHSDDIGDIRFTSFGDHTGCRYAFPDLAWNLGPLSQQIQKADLPPWLRGKAVKALGAIEGNSIQDCGKMLLLLGEGGPMATARLADEFSKSEGQVKSLLELLADMKYVSLANGEASLNYPAFTTEDKGALEAVWDVLSEVVSNSACDYYDCLRTELSGITPLRKGIDPREIYTDIWHWVFGWANRIMAERGFFYDPAKERDQEARYIAWVAPAGVEPK